MKRKLFAFFGFLLLAGMLAGCNLPVAPTAPPAGSSAHNSTAMPPIASPTSTTTTHAAATGGNTTTPPAPTNTDGALTVFVPGGTFPMGSPASDTDAEADERPQHAVTLGGFYIYRHEVTNKMYRACVTAGGCLPLKPLKTGPTRHYDVSAYAKHPVVGVTWRMARDYCTWAHARLPTEAEWELAARSVKAFRYPWGGQAPTCDYANLLGCLTPPDTLAVGSLAAGNSPYGLWDMAGNVWEWVQDWYAPHYYAFAPTFNPLGPPIPEDGARPLKVVRGGGLFSGPENLRGAARLGVNPYRAYEDVGFRCVAAQPAPPPDGYAEPLDRRESSASGRAEGGTRAEDPPSGAAIIMRAFGASCPVGRNITIGVEITLEGDVDISALDVWVESELFECHGMPHPDPGTRSLVCYGPPPPDYLDTDSDLEVAIYYESDILPDGSDWAVFHLDHPTRAACSGEDPAPPARYSASAACPTDGTVRITFTFEPAIRWDSIQMDGMDVTGMCTRTDLNHMICTVPNTPSGDHYAFDVHGSGEGDGREYTWSPWVPVATDCPAEEPHASLGCWEEEEVVVIATPTLDHATNTNTGEEQDCVPLAPGLFVCTVGNDSPDDPVSLEIGLADGSTFTFSAPHGVDCSHPTPTFTLNVACTPPSDVAPEGFPYLEVQTPVGASPAPQSVHIGDTALDCSIAPFGLFCSGLPADPAGTTWNTEICFDDGACVTRNLTAPDCGETGGGDLGWSLGEVGCLNDTDVYVVINTHIDPLTGYRYNLNAMPFSCAPVAGRPGRVLCGIRLSAAPDALQFCLTPPDEDTAQCETFEDFSEHLPTTCVTPEPVVCSEYTDQASCESHGCNWLKDNTCHEP